MPSRTPRTIVDKVSREVGRILKLPDIHERIASTGAMPKPTSPEQFDKMVRDEVIVRTKVFKAAGAKAE